MLKYAPNLEVGQSEFSYIMQIVFNFFSGKEIILTTAEFAQRVVMVNP